LRPEPSIHRPAGIDGAVTTSPLGPERSQRDSYWSSYLSPPLDLTRYRPGAIVLDIGCGNGAQLTLLRGAGQRGIGVELNPAAALACQRNGHAVVIASAEKLPFRNESCPGVLCKVVIPYTDEQLAIAEIGRVLAPGGVGVLYLHGIGYSLRYLLRPDIWKRSVYAAKTIVNTMVYRVAQRQLPGFLGDTLFQSERRLRRYYRWAGLKLESTIPSRRFVGRPVFIGHVVRKEE
jgi:SAM-dependent methyltransferase